MNKTADQRNLETELRDLAAARGAKVNDKGNGHFQIRGRLLVNYYPFAKKATAYLANTTGGRSFVTPAQAVAMAFEVPPVASAERKATRSKPERYKRWENEDVQGWVSRLPLVQ